MPVKPQHTDLEKRVARAVRHFWVTRGVQGRRQGSTRVHVWSAVPRDLGPRRTRGAPKHARMHRKSTVDKLPLAFWGTAR